MLGDLKGKFSLIKGRKELKDGFWELD